MTNPGPGILVHKVLKHRTFWGRRPRWPGMTPTLREGAQAHLSVGTTITNRSRPPCRSVLTSPAAADRMAGVSNRDATRNGLPGERDDQYWSVLTVCEIDGDGSDEQLLQPGSDTEFTGTNDDDGCVDGFRKLT